MFWRFIQVNSWSSWSWSCCWGWCCCRSDSNSSSTNSNNSDSSKQVLFLPVITVRKGVSKCKTATKGGADQPSSEMSFILLLPALYEEGIASLVDLYFRHLALPRLALSKVAGLN